MAGCAAQRLTAVKDALLEFSKDMPWAPVMRSFAAA